MPKQKVEVGQEVKNKCPVCGNKETEKTLDSSRFTFNELRDVKRVAFGCYGCSTDFWLYPCTGKITIKKIDKTYVA